MMFHLGLRPFSALIGTLLSIFVLCVSAICQDKNWRPVTPAELQASTPVVSPNADAEAIFWEVRVDDSSADELALKHYVRIKIFTERGRDNYSRHDIPFLKGTKIKDLEARVTKPDGTVVMVAEKDIIDREIVKASGFKVKAKTIAFPGLELGSVVEYKYKEVVDNGSATMRLIFQRDIPIRDIAYYVKPFSGDNAMAYFPFNMGQVRFEKDKNGFSKAAMHNVPALPDEPFMLPEDEIKSWMYIYYTRTLDKTPEDYWQRISKAFYDIQKDSLGFNDDVKRTAAEITTGAASDDEKLHRIYDFVKTKIKNITYAPSVTDEERKQASKNKSASDTLKYHFGTAGDIDQLFGALARAAGFDARMAFSGNRDEMFFNRNVPNFGLMLGSSSIAVKTGEDWRFFSPASYYVPYGMMSWIKEAQVALIPDSKGPIWKVIPLSEAERSCENRSGAFKLDEDGTLTGTGRVEFTGHQGHSKKSLNRGDSETEKSDRLKAYVRNNIMSTAEVESYTIENLDDPDKPFVYTFKIKVPGYAVKTGKRLFFQPDVYERNSQPLFTAATRATDVYFPYPFSESENITIELPKGFKLENADAPSPVKDSGGISSNVVQIGVTTDGSKLVYKRDFTFGNKGFIRFPVTSYQALKGLFEAINKASVHQLTLRSEATTAAN